MRRAYRKAWKHDAWPMIAMMASARGGWGGRRGGWGSGDWGGRGHRRRGRMFGQGELRLALLKLVADESRHGYELIKAIEELTGGAYAPSPGAVYPTLSLMVDEGAIAEAASDGARKAFGITGNGKAELKERADEVKALFERLTEHGRSEERTRSPVLFRAMGNLANVLRNRARDGALNQEVIDEIVDIIDEAAKRIERL